MIKKQKVLAPFSVTVILILFIAAVVAVVAITKISERTNAEAAGAQVVQDSSHRIDEGPADGPVLVEFLDFECEACAAAFPIVEQLRKDYAGQFTYIIRYFPIPSHQNSGNAAIAVEAASQQGRLEEMYKMMYVSQPSWGEATESQAPLFRQFAESLELDMAKYDAAVADPAVESRVAFDFEEGRNLGVDSTPTFFLDGKKLTIESGADLEEALSAAINK